MENVIKLTDVTFRYGKYKVFDKIRLDVKGNHLAGVIGKNGAGKTTLFRLISGDLATEGGEVRTNELDPWISLAAKQQIAISTADTPYPTDWKISDIMKYYNEAYENFDLDFAKRLDRKSVG